VTTSFRVAALSSSVFEPQRRVDESTVADYQADRYDRRQSFEPIERLALVFVADGNPVEEFEVDDGWRVSFQAASRRVASSGDGSGPRGAASRRAGMRARVGPPSLRVIRLNTARHHRRTLQTERPTRSFPKRGRRQPPTKEHP